MVKRIWLALAILSLLLVALEAGVVFWARAGGGHSASAQETIRLAADDAGPDEQAADVARRPDDAIDELLRAVRVGEGISHRNLKLFPVSLRHDYTDFSPRTFDAAVESGDLVVKEFGRGEVNRVHVKNNSTRPVFIMAGEIMVGSKQDRTAQRDVLIPRKSGWIQVPVYCVEEGRWTVVSPQFRTRRSLAAPSLRLHAYKGEGQRRIWGEVERSAAENAVSQDRTKAFQEIYENKEVQSRLSEYSARLRLPTGKRVVGFVAFAGTRPVGADLFGSEAVFDELKDKLIRSYVLSIGARPYPPRIDYNTVRPEKAAQYLARAWSERCRRIEVGTPGIGQSLHLRNSAYDTSGGALVYRDETVHVALFPDRDEGEPVPIPIPVPRGQGID